MEILKYTFPATKIIKNPVQVGVVGSGNLEILMEPLCDRAASVIVTTSLDGNGELWQCVLGRFFESYPVCASVEINDFGATPGVVNLRLMQAVEQAVMTDEDIDRCSGKDGGTCGN